MINNFEKENLMNLVTKSKKHIKMKIKLKLKIRLRIKQLNYHQKNKYL